ncbi:MAG: 7-cyano-7-deazaguanine synthase QueC [Candidatus Omnitrophica bacterium]|nr:7-cyano-7-deazaguanine synthase QueC [Candidatus Omnitrophota bacterium]
MRNLSQDKKGVILLSGGLDSVTTFYLAKHQGYKLSALIFYYGQRHKREINCAIKIAELKGVDYRLVRLSIPWVESSLTKKNISVPLNRDTNSKDLPSTYVSGRNIIFLSYAASLAESINARYIFIGAHTEDYSGYPDCRKEFLEEMEKAINLGISKKIKILYPLIDKSKRDIVELGKKLDVPFEYTWSCYLGGKIPCQKCDRCRCRIRACQELGLIDPLLQRKKILSKK